MVQHKKEEWNVPLKGDDLECSLEEERGKRPVSRQILLGVMTNFTSIAPSMSLGFSAVALPPLIRHDNPYSLSVHQASWFASIASLATPFGSLLSGPICDRFGRRSALFTINFLTFLGWLIIAGSFYMTEHQFALLLLGRFFTGLSTGLSSMPATIYMAEVSSTKLRGVFTTWSSISFSLGVLLVYFFGFLFKDNWGTIALITAGFPCFSMFLIVFHVPESPVWLVGKDRVEEAKRSLSNIYGTKLVTKAIEEELAQLIRSKGYKKVTKSSSFLQQFIKKIKQLFFKANCRKPLTIVLIFFFFQQFSGIFVIVFYAIDIVKNAGITVDPYLTIVLIGLTRFVTSVITSLVARKVGRRPLAMTSSILMAGCMLILGWHIRARSEGTSYLPVILLLIYFIASTCGLLPLPFAMSAELFPAKMRGVAAGLCSCIGYSFTFITVKIYPDMISLLGSDGVFFFFGGISLAALLFVIFFLPETKGKSFEEIQEFFESKEEKMRKKMTEMEIFSFKA